MGNRAVITRVNEKMDESIQKSSQVGVYLHWNGGRDSVEAFLKYCKLKGLRSPETDNYGWAGLTTVINNFFGNSGYSIGIDQCSNLDCDNYDNGVYFVKNWEIVGRAFHSGSEQNEYNLLEMLIGIDERQPEDSRLGKDKIEELLDKELEEN